MADEAIQPREFEEERIPTPPPPEEWSGYHLLKRPSAVTEEDDAGLGPAEPSSKPKTKKRKKPTKEELAAKNTHVYVTGLPLDVNLEELSEHFSKAGMLKKDPDTLAPKIKIYRDEQGKPKGDALITYYRPESVNLAVLHLDESQIRAGQVIRVAAATFDQTKGSGKKGKGKGNGKGGVAGKKKKKTGYNQAQELSWEEDERRHVVLKHMFAPEELYGDPRLLEELKEDIGTECEKLGPVAKVILFEHNPEGVVVVKFASHWPAVRCIERMNGRWFGGRQIAAEFYDGVTNYKVEESEEQAKRREAAWLRYIEEQDALSSEAAPTETSSALFSTESAREGDA